MNPDLALLVLRQLVERGEVSPDDALDALRRVGAEAFGIDLSDEEDAEPDDATDD